MSRRLREKRNKRANHVAALLAAKRSEPYGWNGMACSYGVHDWLYHFEVYGDTKTCSRCGAVYAMSEQESAELQAAIQAGRLTVAPDVRIVGASDTSTAKATP
jgi:hypothetical protein